VHNIPSEHMGRADSTSSVKSSSDACQLHRRRTQAALTAHVVEWSRSSLSVWKEELDEQGAINSTVSESTSLDVQLQIPPKNPTQSKINQKNSNAVQILFHRTSNVYFLAWVSKGGLRTPAAAACPPRASRHLWSRGWAPRRARAIHAPHDITLQRSTSCQRDRRAVCQGRHVLPAGQKGCLPGASAGARDRETRGEEHIGVASSIEWGDFKSRTQAISLAKCFLQAVHKEN